MGQLLPVLGNSRCGLKPPDTSVPMPSLWRWKGGRDLLVAFGESHGHLTLGPGPDGFPRSSDSPLVVCAFKRRTSPSGGR